MMRGRLTLYLLLLSLIASVLCLTLVLLIDSRCPTSLVTRYHSTENNLNCVVKSVFYLFHRVPRVNKQPVIVAFSTHTHFLKFPMQIVCQHLFVSDSNLVLFLFSLYDFSLFLTWLLLFN